MRRSVIFAGAALAMLTASIGSANAQFKRVDAVSMHGIPPTCLTRESRTMPDGTP